MRRGHYTLVFYYFLVIIVIATRFVVALGLPLSATAEAAIVTTGECIALQLFCDIAEQAPLLVRKANRPAFKRLLAPDMICPPAKAQVPVTDGPILAHRCLLAFTTERHATRTRCYDTSKPLERFRRYAIEPPAAAVYLAVEALSKPTQQQPFTSRSLVLLSGPSTCRRLYSHPLGCFVNAKQVPGVKVPHPTQPLNPRRIAVHILFQVAHPEPHSIFCLKLGLTASNHLFHGANAGVIARDYAGILIIIAILSNRPVPRVLSTYPHL
ncbi:hypothetical protein ACJ41O_005877 [Fusarium nematophilum]